MSSELLKLQGLLKAKTAELVNLKEQWEDFETTSKEVEDELETLLSKAEEKTQVSLKRIASLENLLHASRLDASKLVTDISRVRRKLEECQSSYKITLNKVQNLEQRNDELETALRVSKSTEIRLQERLEVVEEENIFSKQELIEKKLQNRKLEEEKQRLQDLISEFQSDKAAQKITKNMIPTTPETPAQNSLENSPSIDMKLAPSGSDTPTIAFKHNSHHRFSPTRRRSSSFFKFFPGGRAIAALTKYSPNTNTKLSEIQSEIENLLSHLKIEDARDLLQNLPILQNPSHSCFLEFSGNTTTSMSTDSDATDIG